MDALKLCSNFNTLASVLYDDQVYKERLDISSNMYNYTTYPSYNDMINIKDYGYTSVGEFSVPTMRVRAFEPMLTRFPGKVIPDASTSSSTIFDRDRLNVQVSLPNCKNAYNPNNKNEGFVKVNSGGLGYVENTGLTRLKGKDGSTFVNFNMNDKALHNPLYPNSRFSDSRLKRSDTEPYDFRNHFINTLPNISSPFTEKHNDTVFLNLAFKNTQVIPIKKTKNPVLINQGGIDTHNINEHKHDTVKNKYWSS